jgi:tetratricopeptide (TPR) repeat protein
MFLLEVGRAKEAEAAVREAVEIHEWVLASGELNGSVERYAARNFSNLGRVLVAAGRGQEAVQFYRKAVDLLDRLAHDLPESVYPRVELAHTLPYLADLLKQLGRWQEALDFRRREIAIYETLNVSLADVAEHRRTLALSCLELARLFQGLGRQAEAVEPYRKALELEVDDPAVNNDLAWFLVMSPEISMNDAARAVRLAQKAVAGRPDDYNYRNTLGAAFCRSGDQKAAVIELEKAMSMEAGGSPFDWFFLAMAHWRLGNRELARTVFQRSVEWLADRKSQDDELRRIRAEAQELLADTKAR